MYSLPFSGTAPALLAHCNKHSPAQTKLRRPWCRRAVPGRKREVSLDVDGQRQVQQRRVILLRVRPEIRLATVPGRNLVLRQAQDEVFLKPHAEPVEVWGRLGARERISGRTLRSSLPSRPPRPSQPPPCPSRWPHRGRKDRENWPDRRSG